MKDLKILGAFLCLSLVLTGCGQSNNTEKTSNADSEPKEVEKTEIPAKSSTASGTEEIRDLAFKDAEDTVNNLEAAYEKLSSDINSYKTFLNSQDKMDEFYALVLSDTTSLSFKIKTYAADYVEAIVSSSDSNDDKYDQMKDFYDDFYEDACEYMYDDIYDGVLDDAYDGFYDGLLDDAYDNDEYSDYKEYSNLRSDEYKRYSNTRSDVYKIYSNTRSDLYSLYSDVRSELYGDDIERAEKKIQKFRDDIEKDQGKSQSKSENSSDNSEDKSSSDKKTEETSKKEDNSSKSAELVDGMRPEFKSAMDSYESFYDEYCTFMKKYNENSSDTELLTQYTSMLSKLNDMNSSFAEWEDDDLNDAELKYYLEVNSRVLQKLADTAS